MDHQLLCWTCNYQRFLWLFKWCLTKRLKSSLILLKTFSDIFKHLLHWSSGQMCYIFCYHLKKIIKKAMTPFEFFDTHGLSKISIKELHPNRSKIWLTYNYKIWFCFLNNSIKNNEFLTFNSKGQYFCTLNVFVYPCIY